MRLTWASIFGIEGSLCGEPTLTNRPAGAPQHGSLIGRGFIAPTTSCHLTRSGREIPLDDSIDGLHRSLFSTAVFGCGARSGANGEIRQSRLPDTSFLLAG